MKSNYKYIVCSIFVLTGLISCSDDFLQRVPQTDITKENFFSTPKDLDTYMNGVYNDLLSKGTYDDIDSDNTSSYSGGGTLIAMLRGNLSSANATGWDDWKKLRSVNFMLDNVHKTTGDPIDINHYVGIAKYFRAQFYIGKLSSYSDVPWYGKALDSTDPDLYKPADSRAIVADSILSDLDFAVANIKESMGNKTRVHKYVALALMSRFCLYEGTYRKYHSELNLSSSAGKFLEKSIWASEQLMNSKLFEISGSDITAFRALFISTSLENNKEIIQFSDSRKDLNRGNNSHSVMGWQWSLSRSLMESFLMKDGTPFTQVSDYDKKTYVEIFENRDPRLAETFAYPGFSQTNDDAAYIPKPNLGGYDQLKFFPRDPALRQGWDFDYTALPIFRYAEILLNYAEAKAEMGTISQNDLELTINKIRHRVEMPGVDLTTVNSTIDPVMAAYYPNVEGANKGVILEIRRERRVELACEGRRFDDLNRWYAGKRFEDAQQGMYVKALGAMDMTGDDIPDIAILASPNDESPIAGLPDNIKSKLSKFYLKNADGAENSFYLKNGTSGHILFTSDKNLGRQFIEPQYYYRPIPQTQMQLNPNLTQPYGWK